MTDETGPSTATSPGLRQMPRVQRFCTADMLWLTKKTVRPARAISPILPRHFFWKNDVADREDLVHEEDLGLEMRRDRERETQEHAARVALDRRVRRTGRSRRTRRCSSRFRCDLGALHPEDRAHQEDVLAARELRVKPRADLEERADPSADLRPALGGLGDPRQDLEQRALARRRSADEADDLARLHVERDVAERPDRLHRLGAGGPPARSLAGRGGQRLDDRLAQRPVAALARADPVALAEPAGLDRDRHAALLDDIGERPFEAAERRRVRRRGAGARSRCSRSGRPRGPPPRRGPTSGTPGRRRPSGSGRRPTAGCRAVELLGDPAHRIDDGRHEEPQLDAERHDVAHVAIAHVQGGEKQGRCRSSRRTRAGGEAEGTRASTRARRRRTASFRAGRRTRPRSPRGRTGRPRAG